MWPELGLSVVTATAQREEGDLSLAELNDVVHELVRSAKFHQAMLEDVALLAASVDPDGIDKLRTQAAVQLDLVHQNRFTDPMAAENESYWRHRFCCLDQALARLGRFWKSAEVVSLAEASAGRVRRRNQFSPPICADGHPRAGDQAQNRPGSARFT